MGSVLFVCRVCLASVVLKSLKAFEGIREGYDTFVLVVEDENENARGSSIVLENSCF